MPPVRFVSGEPKPSWLKAKAPVGVLIKRALDAAKGKFKPATTDETTALYLLRLLAMLDRQIEPLGEAVKHNVLMGKRQRKHTVDSREDLTTL